MTGIAGFALRFYKRLISPLAPPACRFVPSCSEYAAEAVANHGAACGSAMTLWRLLRCHPFSCGGFDPVPARHHSSPNGANS